MNKSDVSLRIQRARMRYVTQKTMAKAMGISEQYLSDMLKGKREWSEDLLEHVGVERYIGYADKGKPRWMK